MMVVVNENLFFNFLICYKGGIKKDITMRFNLILILLHSLNKTSPSMALIEVDQT